MKDRLLLWIEGPLHFCIAYHLQKMYDCELYAIIDITNKPKEFFINQNLVKFNKICGGCIYFYYITSTKGWAIIVVFPIPNALIYVRVLIIMLRFNR